MNKYYPEIFFRTACIWRLFRKYRDKALFGITLKKWRLPLCGLLLITPACLAWILPAMRRYFSLYYLLRTARQIWQSSPEFLFVFS